MVLLIDNYDSFTYNIFQIVQSLGHEVVVRRNDTLSPEEIESLAPDHIIVSPGPGRPETAGISLELIDLYSGRIPILGVCLGHQAIGQRYGCRIIEASRPCHGKTSPIYHNGRGVFCGLKNPFTAVRYHSLIIDRSSIPRELEITAWTEDGEIMGIRHRCFSVEGVQFHPESIGSDQGIELMSNFFNPRPNPPLIKAAIRKVSERRDLSQKESETVMEEIASGQATPAQIASLLTALAVKGEAVAEIAGFVNTLRRRAVSIPAPRNRPILDTCGTGGDGSQTFNISTCAAFVAAGAGLTVAKHGNRSITSRCGSADLLEALGVNINAPVETIAQALDQIGIAFLFAPGLHPSMKHARLPRLEIGIRTVFNILGPLANPAGADRQLIGVFSPHLMNKMAETLLRLGSCRGLVVHGSGGLDELSLSGPSEIVELRDGWLRSYTLTPEELGLTPCEPGDLQGGSLKTNVEIVLGVLDGEEGPHRDVVLMNSAAAIYLGGLSESILQGVQLARQSIDSGSARQKLDQLASLTGE